VWWDCPWTFNGFCSNTRCLNGSGKRHDVSATAGAKTHSRSEVRARTILSVLNRAFAGSHCIDSHRLSSRRYILCTFKVRPSPEPEAGHKQGKTSTHKTRVVHGSCRNRAREREHENDSEDNNISTGSGIHDKANRSSHPEPAWHDRRSPAQ